MSTGGVLFPKDDKGGRSTTAAAKKIWAAAAGGASESSSEQVASIVKGIKEEKDWRYQYPKHVGAISRLSVGSKQNALGIAKAGLDVLHGSFEFERDGECMPLKDAMSRYTTKSFETGSLTADGGAATSKEVKMPYKGAVLAKDELKAKLKEWAEYGTIEQSVVDAIDKVMAGGSSWLDLSGMYFVLLGAGSEIGPLKVLLECGANVVAIRTRKPAAWRKTFSLVKEGQGGGKLMWPQAEGSEGPEEDRAGCDLITEAPEIRNWLLSILPEGAKVVVGCYTYLDSDAHVRISMACDAIMAELVEKRQATLAYLASPAVDCLLPRGCTEAMEENRAASPFWMRATGAPALPVSKVGDRDLLHGCIITQGPNYALAKTLQNWRCILAREGGATVSANIAPAARTESVVHNATMKVVLDGLGYMRPNEAFDPDTAGALMAWLLIHDIKNESSSASAKTQLEHPWDLFAECAVHGGSWRCGFNVEGSNVLGAAVFMLGKLAPIK